MRRTVRSLVGSLALVAGVVLGAGSPGGVAGAQAGPSSNELEVVEQGFQPIGDAIRWGVTLHNPNADTWVAAGTVEATFLDAGDGVVGTASQAFGHLGPDETKTFGTDFTQIDASPASMTVNLLDVRWTDEATLDDGALTATIVDDGPTPDGYRHVVAAVRSTLESGVAANVAFVVRDRGGALLGVSSSWAAVPAGGEAGSETDFIAPSAIDSIGSIAVEVDWEPSRAFVVPAGVRPIEVVESGAGWTGGRVSWGALVRNPNDAWVASLLEVTTTFRNPDGTITGADFLRVAGDVLPGATFGVGTFYDRWPPEGSTIELSVVTNWVQYEIMPAHEVTFDEVTPQLDGGLLSGVTAVMTVPPEAVGVGIDIGAIYRDAAGGIVGGKSSYALPEAATETIDVSADSPVAGVTSVDLYGAYIHRESEEEDAGGFRPVGTFSPEVATHIPAPSDVSTDPPVVYANLILAALAVLALTIGMRLLNTTLVAHEDALEGVFRPARALGRLWTRADRTVSQRAGRGAGAVRIGGVLLFYGVLFSFLEPGWRPWTVSGLFVLAAMTIAFGAVGTGDDLVELRSAHRWGLPAQVVVKPALVLFAVGSVALTKFAGLVPGLMIGTPEAFSMEDEVSERDESRLAAVGLGSTAAIGLGAWVLAAPLDGMLDGSGGFVQGLAAALVTLLLLIFAVSVENLFANLLPFRGSEGRALRRRSRAGWWAGMIAVTVLFFHTLINPSGDLGESLQSTNVRVVLATVGAFVAMSVAVFLVFRRRDRQQHLSTGGGPASGIHPPAAPA